MNSSYVAYKLLTVCSSVIAVPLIWLHHRFRGSNFDRFYHRLGCYPQSLVSGNTGRPRIWIHAVSVGEVGVAAAISEALYQKYPHCSVVLSTLREQGLARAKALLGDGVVCFFAPLDMMGATQKALKMFRPDVLVLLETEIWPNLIVGAQRMGIRTVIANGRISVRSIKKYHKIRSLMNYTLGHVDAFSMISESDAQRIQSLGAAKERITINGNAKFDVADPLKDPNARQWAADLYNITEETFTLVAGSTRNPEEPVILEAFARIHEQFPNTVLIIAPRHIERAGQILQWVTAIGLECQLRTQLEGMQQSRCAPVVILDTIGELSATYGIADMVFCGGSLVPKGGQNILEPAMWAKPVVYGPSMEDFEDATQLIQSNGGGILIHDAAEMAAVICRWIQSPQKARAAGMAARQAILPHGGASRKHARVISDVLGG
ncbi:MAG: 3-deoxy-D-manno-octulosonic acid transferase [Desulfobacteraceae bacterium]|jgi:3-deoxy-D-manno-octulosonic-acid transferase